MIFDLVKKYETIDRDIKWLTWLLITYCCLVLFRIIYCLYIKDFNYLFEGAKSLLPPLTALLVVQVANRLIINNRILEENEQRVETVQSTHHAIVIVKDLKAKVGYVKHCIENNRPPIALVEVAARIEMRYESLFERNLYKYLQGESIDLIARISGTIFGIQVFAEQLKQQITCKKELTLENMPKLNSDKPLNSLDDLLNELDTLLDHLYEIREKIN
ncbi:hypothetical protein PA25_20130 [Pseudoalteromonas sp. A25]|uniref:hypothetical protein n=1 Tax=Pseudoalteromonas sp. A25 TaxID=116092 RepID=UPI0012610E79|nr:hypothetical protein [Pseudoalteromonas sp. A25]BBN82028.1 hypothetical protein PA25_20130 [Pseudoalteromonas sp. A25]